MKSIKELLAYYLTLSILVIWAGFWLSLVIARFDLAKQFGILLIAWYCICRILVVLYEKD